MVATTGETRGQLDWLLADFLRRTPGVIHALVVSGDGLRVAGSREIDPALSDQLSAAASGLVSLSRGVCALLGRGPMTQTIIEMANGHLFVTPMSEGSTLAVVADLQCDLGMVGYEMTMLSAQVGHVLTPVDRMTMTERGPRTGPV
jgi:predicted regulator of Ras-like GTPase activity (Roadblock/LC7/MglB family)